LSTLRFPDPTHWDAIERHLAGAPSERFAFALTRALSNGPRGPVLRVVDVELVADNEVVADITGWTIADVTLDRIHNRAVAEGLGLVEFHNHGSGAAAFSPVDEAGLVPMAEYAVDLLGGRPYGAGVWAGGALHAEWFRQGESGLERGVFRTVTVLGQQLRCLTGDLGNYDERFARQVPLLGQTAQAAVRQLRVAVVGAGGTGSHAIILLAYLGVRDFVLLDDDVVDPTSLNRLVTAEPPDIHSPKTMVARRRVLALAYDSKVDTLPGVTPLGEHGELLEADMIFGCVDNDGPRHRLNSLAVEAGIPYIDIGTGVDPEVSPAATGARISFVLPGGPCLGCTDELDVREVGRWYKPLDQQELDRVHGYGVGEPAPSVVHLNGLAVSAALGEVAAWISGARRPATRLDVDLNGSKALPGTRVLPSNDTSRRSGCIECSWVYGSAPQGEHALAEDRMQARSPGQPINLRR
jgi:hypothetical protein